MDNVHTVAAEPRTLGLSGPDKPVPKLTVQVRFPVTRSIIAPGQNLE